MRYLNDPAWMKQLDESILASIPPRTFTVPGYSLRFYLDGVYTEGRMIVQKDGQLVMIKVVGGFIGTK